MKLDANDIHDLKPLIAEAVSATLAQLAANDARLPNNRLGFTEPEAAEALGVRQYVLRDARLRGEIKARKCGKRYVYGRAQLIDFLNGE